MTDFICEVDEQYRSACKGLDLYRDHEGKQYCVLHFPGEKKEDFEQIRKSKLDRKDYDFGGAIFPEDTSRFEGYEFDGDVNFFSATFSGVTAFSGAQFSGDTNFEWALFSGVTDLSEAQFSGETDFSGARFSGVTYLREVHFGGDTNFSEAQFSEVTDLSEAQFSGETTDFKSAQFSGEWTYFREAHFGGETNFSGARFSGGIDFREAQFSGETNFEWARFNEESYFREAHFGGDTNFKFAEFSGETNFSGVQFSGAENSFREAAFKNVVDFSAATFKEVVDFWGRKENWVFASKAGAWFDSVRIEKPEKLSFNTVLLHPGWFIDTDVRKVDFTDVKWYGMLGANGTLDGELSALEEHLEEHKVEARHRLLAQACRRLSANAEENREYPLANDFHYWSMDATRKGDWSFFKALTWRDLLKRESWPSIARYFSLITTLYWALSGYGVRAVRAFWVLVGMCATFAVLYMLLGPPKLEDLGQALVYSLGAVARLNPEPRPTEPGVFQFLVIVEGLLGPLQIALLALAVRRKVMR